MNIHLKRMLLGLFLPSIPGLILMFFVFVPTSVILGIACVFAVPLVFAGVYCLGYLMEQSIAGKLF